MGWFSELIFTKAQTFKLVNHNIVLLTRDFFVIFEAFKPVST